MIMKPLFNILSVFSEDHELYFPLHRKSCVESSPLNREPSEKKKRVFHSFLFIVHFQIMEVQQTEDQSPVKYSSEVLFYVDKYEIV